MRSFPRAAASSFHPDDERRPIVEIPHVEDMAVPERDAEPSDGGLGAQRLLQCAINERDPASGIYGVVKPCGERRASLSLTAWHN